MRRAVPLGVLLVVLFCLASAPARVVGYWLPKTLQLGGFTGTVWNGQAARATLSVAGKPVYLGSVSWRLHPASLITLRPRVTLSSRWGIQRVAGTLVAGLGGAITFHDAELVLDPRFLHELMPLFIGGRVEAQFEQIGWSFAEGGPKGPINGRIVWRNAVWTARGGDVALGNYVLELADKRDVVRGKLQTLSGPLSVQGELQWQSGAYGVEAQLRGPATSNPGLRSSLSLLAVPVDGGFDLNLQGRL